MQYSQFERLIIGATALLVVFTLAASFAAGSADVAEIVGQLAIVGVMAVAVHWGRRRGTVAALIACLLYLALRMPVIAAGATPQALLLVASRFAGYCLVGIVGGEIFGRVKYLFAAEGNEGALDEWSRVYSQRHAAISLMQAIERSERYGEGFAVVLLRLETSLTASQRPEQLRSLVRAVAAILRDDVRMVDDVARLDDGRFFVLLPHTPGAAAPIVADRVAASVRHTVGATAEQVTTQTLGADTDIDVLRHLLVEIAPEQAADTDADAQAVSGA
ncbi:MAG: hypothetical protein HGB10_03390 [Coriobacteriia bacterium]|nr:hypothetical protein [Coriobacteriia bacterium]